MVASSLRRYSRYVVLMKVLLSVGILAVLGLSLGGPLHFISSEAATFLRRIRGSNAR
jgi:hypothetical protein